MGFTNYINFTEELERIEKEREKIKKEQEELFLQRKMEEEKERKKREAGENFYINSILLKFLV